MQLWKLPRRFYVEKINSYLCVRCKNLYVDLFLLQGRMKNKRFSSDRREEKSPLHIACKITPLFLFLTITRGICPKLRSLHPVRRLSGIVNLPSRPKWRTRKKTSLVRRNTARHERRCSATLESPQMKYPTELSSRKSELFGRRAKHIDAGHGSFSWQNDFLFSIYHVDSRA